MRKFQIGRVGMAATVVFSIVTAASDLSAQFQPPGSLGALAPDNLNRSSFLWRT